MSLSDLCLYTPAQNEKLIGLQFGIQSNTKLCRPWNQVRDDLWGKGLESFQKLEKFERHDPSSVADVIIPEHRTVATMPESLRLVFWILQTNKILVRSEYNETERATLPCLNRGRDLFLIIGQPGIGKSLFLLWLLMRRLALKLPTAFQYTDAYAVLFHDAGVSELTYLGDPSMYGGLNFSPENPSSRIWALVDLDDTHLSKPAGIFMASLPFFIVAAASPRSNLTWIRRNYSTFYMKSWTLSEMILARSSLGRRPYTEHQLCYLHNTFGVSPGDLEARAYEPEEYEQVVRREINAINPADLQQIFRDPGSFRSFQYVCVVEPSPDSRYSPVERVASRYVFTLLWEKFIRHRIDEMASFYDRFKTNPLTSAAAGWIFEFRMHQLLRREQTIRLFPIHGHCANTNIVYNDYSASRKEKNSKSIRLTSSEEYHLVERSGLQKNRYYLLKSPNLPALDSLVLVKKGCRSILLMFRFIWNESDHHIDLDTLHKIDDLELLPKIPKYIVVVTTEGIQPKVTVPMAHFRDRGLDSKRSSPDKVFPVFHYHVPPNELFKD